MKVFWLVLLSVVLFSCKTMPAQPDLQDKIAAVKLGKRYAFFTNSAAFPVKMKVETVDADSISGTRHGQKITVETKNIKAIRRDNAAVPLLITAGSLTFLIGGSVILINAAKPALKAAGEIIGGIH